LALDTDRKIRSGTGCVDWLLTLIEKSGQGLGAFIGSRHLQNYLVREWVRGLALDTDRIIWSGTACMD